MSRKCCSFSQFSVTLNMSNMLSISNDFLSSENRANTCTLQTCLDLIPLAEIHIDRIHQTNRLPVFKCKDGLIKVNIYLDCSVYSLFDQKNHFSTIAPFYHI